MVEGSENPTVVRWTPPLHRFAVPLDGALRDREETALLRCKSARCLHNPPT